MIPVLKTLLCGATACDTTCVVGFLRRYAPLRQYHIFAPLRRGSARCVAQGGQLRGGGGGGVTVAHGPRDVRRPKKASAGPVEKDQNLEGLEIGPKSHGPQL
jgi:hypothetical protein